MVLDEAVATEDGVDLPHHVRSLQLPEAHDRKLMAGYKKWTATSHSCEDDTPTHIHTQDLLKGMAAAHQEGLPKRNQL